MSFKEQLFSKDYLFYLLLAFSTSFFVYQHSTGISWDFSAYVLNAKYIFSSGIYFEWARPPLAPLMIGAFSIFGWAAAEYAYIIFVSLLFAYSSVLFAKHAGIDKTLYYMLALTPFALNFGLSIGTELLQLALLQLSLAWLHSSRFGVFVSLLSLSHYSKIVYTFLAFFKKDAKKIIATLAIVLAFFAPWLLANYLLTGDALTSIADQYALSVKFRDYMKIPASIDDVTAVGGYYLLLLPLGMYAARRKLLEEALHLKKAIGIVYKPIAYPSMDVKQTSITLGAKPLEEKNLVILAVLLISLLTYVLIPHKEARYLFTMTLPLAYFSCLAVGKLRMWREIALLIVAMNATLALANFTPLESAGRFTSVQADNCMLSSNAWVYLDYFGKNAEPYPGKQFVLDEIESGNRIILFKGLPEPDYLSDRKFMDSLPKITENENYVILGNASRCAPLQKVDVTYLEQLKKRGVNISTCEVLLPSGFCSVFR